MTYTFDDMMADIEKDRKQDTTQAYKDYATGISAGKAEPREFYQWSNLATKRINELWSTYTGVPVNSASGRNQHKCVAKLLTDTPDVELIERAVRGMANDGRFGIGIDMYHLRKLVENEVSKLKLHDQRMSDMSKYMSDIYDDGNEGPETCTKCGRDTYRPGEECQWH